MRDKTVERFLIALHEGDVADARSGIRFEPVALPTGRDDVDSVLRAYLAARS